MCLYYMYLIHISNFNTIILSIFNMFIPQMFTDFFTIKSII